jgi:hypothetical protein
MLPRSQPKAPRLAAAAAYAAVILAEAFRRQRLEALAAKLEGQRFGFGVEGRPGARMCPAAPP